MRDGYLPKEDEEEKEETMDEKCTRQFGEMSGADLQCSWTEFNTNHPSDYMNNWTEKERQFAFDEYNGNDETMVVSEWLNLCAKLHTDWKPVVPDTMEEKCEKQFVTMSGTDGVCTYAEFASNHD